MHTDCIFCAIAAKTIPSEIVYEDESFLAFLDINPVNEGHVLLIPKEHFPKLVETPDEVIREIFVRAKQLMPAVQEATGANFVVLTIVGTDVPHLHIHLIPRFHEDGLAGFWPAKKYDSSEQMHAIGEGIRSALSN